MTDPIADMLSRIRNAIIAGHDRVKIPHSVVKSHIVRVLKEEGYIDKVEVSKEDNVKKFLILKLKYTEKGESAINEIKRVSKLSRRVYAGRHDIPRVKAGMGISILSTSKGIVTGVAARKQGIGGEVICTVS